MPSPCHPSGTARPPSEARSLRRRTLHGAESGFAPSSQARLRARIRAAGGKVRRRLRSLEPGFLGQYFPALANSAVVEALQEHGPQQVFRISPLLTRFVALWSLLAFFATDFPVRAATYVWNGSSDLLWTTPANWTTASVPTTLDIGSFALSAGTAAYLNSSTSALGLSFVGAGTGTLLGGTSGLAGSGTLTLGEIGRAHV